MKKHYYLFLLTAIFTIFLNSADLKAQQDLREPIKRAVDEERVKSNQTKISNAPSPDAPQIIINVPANYSTIQAAINAANNGDIITIDAGIYREDITLNKFLQIRGANYGINPNTGIRVAETIIQPATSQPDVYLPGAVTFFYITPGGSGSIIDGITFDGDNTLLTSSVNINGANIDAAEAIGAYDGLSNTKVTNNILKNINYAAIDFDNYFNGMASTYDNLISDNLFDNINVDADFGIGVLLYDNCYTRVTNNVMTRVRIGVQTGNFFQPDLGANHSIDNNEIESSRLGIWHNLTYSNATTYTIENNEITTVSGSLRNIGIEISSVQTAVVVNLNNNNITGASEGYDLWNCPTSSTITITGGIVANCNVGVFANNYDGYSSDAASSQYAMTGVTITNCDTSIWVRDNVLNTNSATVSLSVNNATNFVNGSGIGLLLEGGDATVNFNGAAPVDFNTTLSKYIRLITNGTNVPAANINAQNVMFGGANGTGLNNTQLFSVEDKIDHKIDWNSLGFVSVKANNDYVTVNSFYTPNTSVASIQNTIGIAVIGDTVNIGPGTFNENVTVNKSITLTGNGTGSTILTPSISCTGDGITVSSSSVSVRDLTVTDFNYGLRTSTDNTTFYNVESIANCSYGLISTNGTRALTLLKCKLNNNIIGGWRVGTADVITNVMIDSCEVMTNGVGVNNGFGIFVGAATPVANTFDTITIRNSDFSNNLKKGMYFEKLRNALIENVYMNNSGNDPAYGFNNGIDINLKYDSYSGITIRNCTITNCGLTGTAGNIDNPAAITVKARDDSPSYNSDPATLTGVVIENNFISGPVNGLRFGEFDKVNNSPTGVTVEENHFGNGYSNKAILNKTSGSITVSCNWYGTAVPAAVVALHGSNLNFIPYVVNGTDNDPGSAGFQIVPGSCTGVGPVTNITQSLTYATIAPAITAANPGDVIELSAGTYNERVVITKSLTLYGVDKTTCIISGTGLAGTGRGIAINNNITNVTIENLTVQNFAGSNGNTDAGIYGIGGNNNLTVNNVVLQNNVGGSGFYANGPVNTVLLDSVTSSGHTSNARGIVIWNGLKENITITNCIVFNNNCCGVELQDGTASGVTISNNNIYDNFDNGIGLVGLQGPGENVVSNNTLLNNGRFGIEIKNPNGSGLPTGAGRVVIENNNVSRTLPIVDVRDIAGIAVFRRGVLAGNVDVPNGTVVQNNTVAGYVQPSTSEGFGIVIEGTSHTVTGNTVSGCDIGIQRQAGHLPYPGDGNQNDIADTYFGRGNSPATCMVTLSGNTLTNTIDTRDVGNNISAGLVTNINSTESFCSIQTAVNDAQTLSGHTIEVSPGTYNEQVIVNKGVVIKGVGAVKPVMDFTGTVSGKPTLMDVSVQNVTIENMRMRVDMTKLNSAVIASGTNIDNITITNDSVEAYGSSAAGTFGSYSNRNAISINYGGGINYRIAAGGVDNITVQGSTVSGVVDDGFGVPRYFRAAVSVDEGGGLFTNNIFQSINHDVLVRFGNNGNVDVTNNQLNGGGVEFSDMNAGAGILTVSGNTFEGSFANVAAANTAVLRLKNNYNFKTTMVSGNTFTGHMWGASVENYNSLTIDNNTFTPASDSTTFHHIAINTKSISTNSNAIIQVSNSAVLTNNTFNYSGANGGTALSFHNHDNDNAVIGSYTIGNTGNENTFNSGFSNFIYLDNQTGASNTSAFPAYTSMIGAGPAAITTMGCWSVNLDIEDNRFDVGSGLQLPSAMNFAQRSALETALFHKVDNMCLGNLLYFLPVHNITQNTYYQTIQSSVAAANPNDVIECAEFTYNERVTIDKSLTLYGVDKTNCIVDGTGLGMGRGIAVNNGITNVTIEKLTVQNFAGSNGNTDAGIYGIGGNNYLTVNNVVLQNNVGGSGFYANGPVNTVLLDSVTSSGHTSNARGIVIWNGLKENITITNCIVFNNNCCGVELQDGTASGVTISNNNIYDNFDNGIGLVGLQGPGENVVSNNTLLNNGRFGIEIKNPNGSGLPTGAGRVVIENNNVSRTLPIVDTRDIAGIAVFRRGVLAGNVDVPNGTVVQNNTVAGYMQPSTSEGFGIVIEGTSHTVSGNTVSGCDIGIQRQAGHLPYPGDGNQNDIADTYFGRGNSPITCGVNIFGNTLTNVTDTRDVGSGLTAGVVTNTNTNEVFCSIQAAINDAQTLNTHTIDVDTGYYSENVIVSKELTLFGNISNPSSKPVVEGSVGQTFSVTVPNVTINNFVIRFNQIAVTSGIKAATSGSFNNLTIKNNEIEGTANTGVPIFNSFGIQAGNAGGPNYDQLNIDSNEIKHTGNSPLGRGVRTLNCYGDWTNNEINGFYSFQSGDIQGGLLNIESNDLKGNAEINYLGNGAHSFINNICEPSNAYGGGTDFAMIELKNITLPGASLMVSGNSIQNYVNFGIFSGRSGNVTIDNNTFIPDLSAVNFRSIRIDTKQRTLAPQPAFTSNAVITNNTFNGNSALGQTGISVELANSDSLSSIGTVTVGTLGDENLFKNNVHKKISLNNETLSTAGDPVWLATYVSTKKKVNVNVDATNNQYDEGAGLESPASMSLTNLFSLEDRIQHGIDDGGLGFVLVKANHDFVTVNSFVSPVTTVPSVQRGVNAALPGFIVNVGPGNFTEQIEINKSLNIKGQGTTVTNIISPNVLTLSFMTGVNVNKPVIYVHDASDVFINDISVDGAGKGNANNRFIGIAYRNAGGEVNDCEIKAIRNTPMNGAQAGVGLYALADNGNLRTLNVKGNSIYDFQKNATVFAGADLRIKADSNTVTGSGPVNFIAQNGFQLSTGASGSIRGNTISNLSYTPSTAVSTGILLYQSAGPDTTSGNLLTACQMGIYYIDVGGLISENTLNATAVNTGTVSYWGIDADPGGTPRVAAEPFDAGTANRSGNRGDNMPINTMIYRNTLTSDGTNGVGIEMDAIGTETLNATATENKVSGWDAAIYFYKDAGATLNGVANDNDLSGNTYALFNQTGVSQNATCNWFGTTESPNIASAISGVVTFAPFLTNGTDDNPGVPGFQPVPLTCNGLAVTTINVKVLPEGFYNLSGKLNMKDTVRVYLHSTISPYNVLDTSVSVVDSVSFTGIFTFSQPSGTYYIVAEHRNSIETWSKSGGEPYVEATIMNYDFTNLATQAFGSNMTQVDNSPVVFGMYSGDVNQDDIIDLSDLAQIDNDVNNFATGYIPADANGDGLADLSDYTIADNNAFNTVMKVAP